MDLVDLPHSDAGPRSAPAVILLHGFPLDHTMWSPVARALSSRFRVLVPDLRGLGKAPLGHSAPGMAPYAGDVLRLADRAGLRTFSLAGFSMGGYVAFEVARQAPDRVARLALVDTRAEADSDDARKGRAATVDQVRAKGTQVLVDGMLGKMLTPQAPPALVESTRRSMLAAPVEGAAFALQAMGARPDSFDTLRRYGGPVLVIVGDDDAITPPSAAEAMTAAAKDARLVRVPGAHLTPLESADRVAEALNAWLSR